MLKRQEILLFAYLILILVRLLHLLVTCISFANPARFVLVYFSERRRIKQKIGRGRWYEFGKWPAKNHFGFKEIGLGGEKNSNESKYSILGERVKRPPRIHQLKSHNGFGSEQNTLFNKAKAGVKHRKSFNPSMDTFC